MSTAPTKALAFMSQSPHQHCEPLLKRSPWSSACIADACWLYRERLLLLSLGLLAICGMVLLLLWNYQCFIVNRMCQDLEHSSEYVMFDMDEQRLSSYGPA